MAGPRRMYGVPLNTVPITVPKHASSKMVVSSSHTKPKRAPRAKDSIGNKSLFSQMYANASQSCMEQLNSPTGVQVCSSDNDDGEESKEETKDGPGQLRNI